MSLAGSAFVAAIVVALIAFGVPLFAFADGDEGLVHAQAAMMKTEARHWSDIPPLRIHIVEADVDPDVSYPSLPDGRLEWRTLFGVSYATTLISGGQSATDFRYGKLLATVSAFFAAEASLLGFGLWRGWTSP